jgi:predicted glycoside hydrolase/deacetylase ChbG (UPF0249 family)
LRFRGEALKKLIVTADDLGADEFRNSGIFEAIESGAAASTSILANGCACGHAIAKIKNANFKVSAGVHLNISEGKPLSSGLQLLVGPDGLFHGKAETHRRIAADDSEILRSEIRREFSAQIIFLKEAGVPITHLDGHQHIHIFPAALEETIRAAKQFGIPWIRIPEEPAPTGKLAAASAGSKLEAETFSRYAARARSAVKDAGLKMTDHFRGLYLKGFFSPAHIEEILQDLPSGLTELMTHPGLTPKKNSSELFSPFSSSEREEELKVLTGSRFQIILKENGIRISSFAEELL